MISARPPWRAFSRRAFARISITVTRGLSSRYSGTLSMRLIARPILVQSASASRPRRSFCDSTSASLDRIRCVSSAWPISSENTSTGFCVVFATWVAMPKPKRGLAHRRAGTDDVEGARLQAGEHLVEIVEAGGGAGDDVAALERLLQLVHRQRQQVRQRPRGVDDAIFGDLEHLGLGLIERLGDIVGLHVRDLGDLAGDADQPAQHRRVLHDLRVARLRWRLPAWRSAARAAPASHRSRRAGRCGATRRRR